MSITRTKLSEPVYRCPYCKAKYTEQTWRCDMCKTSMIMITVEHVKN